MKNETRRPSSRRRQVLQGLAVLAAAPSILHAQGVAYPQKPVRIVVPYTPGGSNDVMARTLAEKMQQAWGQPVVVDNKPGASGNIGAAEVARAPADGYTLLLTNVNITSMNPALSAHLPFDAQKDFAPISLLATTSMALVVHPSVPVHDTRELIKYLRERPGKLSYASSGNGSPQHMSAEMFKAMTGTRIVHIPYRGAAPAVADVLGGQVEMTFGVVNQLLPHIRSGRLRAIAVTSKKRLASLPEVPTLDESGVRGYESEIWLGLAAPAGTPAPVIARINGEVHNILGQAETASKLASQGMDVLVSTPEQMRLRAAQDLKRWSSIINTAGIRSD